MVTANKVANCNVSSNFDIRVFPTDPPVANVACEASMSWGAFMVSVTLLRRVSIQDAVGTP